MNRGELLEHICPNNNIDICCSEMGKIACKECDTVLNTYLDEYDKQIRADAIEEFADWLVEQGILGNRCISDGEITDYGKVYAKKYKEQLEEQKK